MLLVVTLLICSAVVAILLLIRDSSGELLSPVNFFDALDGSGGEETIHRILLWDKKFPIRLRWMIRRFKRKNQEIRQYLWREPDFLRLLDQYPQYEKVYFSYKKRIQRADFARYLIVYHCGGTYADLDIKPGVKKYADLIDKYQHFQTIFFEELTWKEGENDFTEDYLVRQNLDPSKRKEASLRVANYMFFSRPGAEVLRKIIDKCIERSDVEIREPYDVIFTTGPDVVSTVIDEMQDDVSFIVVEKCEADTFFKHIPTHNWHREI